MADVNQIPGFSFLGNIDIAGFMSGVGSFVMMLITILVIGGVVAILLYFRKEKKRYDIKLEFFEEMYGRPVRTEIIMATEMTVPNTNIRLFYGKAKDLYLPRGVRKMGAKSYWYMIKQNREIVNFDLVNINKLGKAEVEYDHTDQRYASENLREIIKRNYRDKATKWWKEYKEIISLVIYVFVLSLCLWYTFRRLGELIGQLGEVARTMAEISKNQALIQEALRTSGLIGA